MGANSVYSLSLKMCGSLTGVLYPELLEGSSCRLGFYPLKGNRAEQDEGCVIEGDFLSLS